MAKYNFTIECKGIANITPRGGYMLEVEIEECDIGFISEIEAVDIVSNCNDTSELLEAIDDDDILTYLEKSGVIFNKE